MAGKYIMKNTNQPLEIWKDIVGYEGYYQVSNYGRVKSLERIIFGFVFGKEKQCKKIFKERILRNSPNEKGYLRVCLCLKGKQSVRLIHLLVAELFLNHRTNGTVELVVDHKDYDKNNNKASNLQIITNRENCTKDRKRKYGSKRGTTFRPKSNKWQAMIQINKKNIYLGLFKTEEEASIAYENKLLELNNAKNK